MTPTGHTMTTARAAGPGGTWQPGAAPANDDELRETVCALEARKELLTGVVAALAAPDSRALELFEAVLADPATRNWPFDLARAHLLFGERLRRAREISRARHHLEQAHAAFARLGAAAWADRAAAELAATAALRRRADAGAAGTLTVQERQVAELAAAGLSNKEIGRRLYMSHRTVSAHLYRVFPKLGIGSRAALRDALSQLSPPDGRRGERLVSPRPRSG